MKVFSTLKAVVFLLLTFCCTQTCFSQILAWDFVTNTGTTAGSAPATTKNASLENSSLSRGAGLTAGNFNYSYFSTFAAATATKAVAISSQTCYIFTVQTKSPYVLSLSTLDAKIRRNGSGPTTIRWQYSIDGATFTDLGATDVTLTTATDGDVQSQINLAGITELQNLTSATTVTFRLLGWVASSGGGFAIGRIASTAIAGNTLAVGGTITPSNPLPVRLTSFKGKNENNNIKLNWATASEQNNSHFDILRSANAKDFQTVGSVNGKGTTSEQQLYAYTDYHPLLGTNYYKLRQVDFDGTGTDSETIAVETGFERNKLQVASTVADQVNITVYLKEKSALTLKITDLSGKSVLNEKKVLTEGLSSFDVPFSLQTGVYIVSLQTDKGELLTAKFVK